MFLNEKIMTCCDFAFSINKNSKSTLTLKGRRNRSGKLETCVNSGAYACAVVGAATLVRPQRPTGLKSRASTYDITPLSTSQQVLLSDTEG